MGLKGCRVGWRLEKRVQVEGGMKREEDDEIIECNAQTPDTGNQQFYTQLSF